MTGEEAASIAYMGIKISNVNYERTYGTLSGMIGKGEKGYVCLNDVGNIIEATRDNDLKVAINEATLSLADGLPLARFAQLVGCTEIERISGVRLMQRMLSERDGFKHLLLGDTEDTISRVIAEAKRLNSNIRITGHSPPFRQFAEDDNRRILSEVNKQNPDVIWVSLGGGRQEKWMHQHLPKVHRGVMIGVGAAFRWLTGQMPIPPELVQRMGLQWAYRLLHELWENPAAAVRRCKDRKIFHNKAVFIANFPLEVAAARKHLKQKQLLHKLA